MIGPIDRLSETIFSILILLTFTLAYRIFEFGGHSDQPNSAVYASDLIVAALGAVFAWALIDGIMYVLLAVFERSEKHRLLVQIQAATTQEEGIEAIAEEFDHILEPITQYDKRQLLYTDILEQLHDSRPQPVRVTGEDLAGAVGCVIVALIAVLPSLVPMILLRNNFELGIRISNFVSFIVLFYAGYQWGQHSGANPWKTGLLMSFIGAILVLIAIPLGG